VIRRGERERKVGKTSNAAFPPGHHIIPSGARRIARGQAVDDLEEGGFAGDPTKNRSRGRAKWRMSS